MNNLAPRLDMCMKCTQSSAYFAVCSLLAQLRISPFRPCCTRSLARADIILYVFFFSFFYEWGRNQSGSRAALHECMQASMERPKYNARACEKKEWRKKKKKKRRVGERMERKREMGGGVRLEKGRRRGGVRTTEGEGKKSHFIHKVWL